MKVLRCSFERLFDAMGFSGIFAGVVEIYGFNCYEPISANKLIELSGEVVVYYDFVAFLVLENSSASAANRMECDKGIKCYYESRKLSLLDFVYYSDKADTLCN